MLKKRGEKRNIKCCARISYCCYFPNILHHNPKGAGKDFCPTSPVLMSFLKPYYLLITLTLLKRKKHSLHFQGFFAFLILFFFFPKTGCILAISSLPWLLQSYKHLCLCSHIMVKTKAVYNAILTRQIYHSLPPSHLPRGKKKKKLDFNSFSLWPSPHSAEFDDLSVNINITPLKTSEIQHKWSTQAYCSAKPSAEKVLTQHTHSHTKNLQKSPKYFCNVSHYYIDFIWFSEPQIPYAICN